MLISAFNKESDSVFVDLLTGSDLEALKARKMGNTNGTSSSSSSSNNVSMSSSQVSGAIKKRYIILTYSGEFDRVHYPLPLPFEETPNPLALRRTISRLRKQLDQSKKGNDTIVDTSNDKDLRVMITQLRQENTELRHRLRQLQGKGTNNQKDTATSDLTIANSKLRKQVEILRKDLVEAGIAYEKLRTDSAREIGRWKAKFGTDKERESAGDPLDFYTKQQGSGDVILRKRVAELEKELQYYRRSTSMKDAARSAGGVRSSSFNAFNAYNGSRSTSAPIRQRSASPISTTNKSTQQNKGRPTTAGSKTSLTSSNASNIKSSVPQTRGRSASPSHQIASSSLGKRFDPTAYQQSRADKLAAKKNAWGSADANRSGSSSRYVRRESGYSSANSDGSRGSRASRGSDGIYGRRHSGNMSDASQGSDKGRKEKKRSSKKSYVKQSGSDSEDEVIARNLKAKYNPVKVQTHLDLNTSTRSEQVVTLNTTKALTSPTRPLTNFTGSSKGIAEDNIQSVSRKLTIDADNDDDDSVSGDENEKLDLNRQTVLSPKDRMKPEQIRESRRNGITSESVAGIAATNIALNQSYDSTVRASNESFSKSPPRNQSEGSLKDVKSPSRLQRLSKEVPKSPQAKKGPEQDISEIDRRIQALQNYLDNARMGILSNDE